MTAADPDLVAQLLAKPAHQRTARECRIIAGALAAAPPADAAATALPDVDDDRACSTPNCSGWKDINHDQPNCPSYVADDFEETFAAVAAGTFPLPASAAPTISGPEILAILKQPPVEGGEPVPLEVPGLVDASDAKEALRALAELHRRRAAEREAEFAEALDALDRGELGPDPSHVSDALDAEDAILRSSLEEAKKRVSLEAPPVDHLAPMPYSARREHLARLDMATRLVAAWTVGNAHACDQIVLRLASHTLNVLDSLVRGEHVDFVLDADPALATQEKPKE